MFGDLRHVVQRLGHPRILVLGDIILDRYIFGSAERVSQEAPVPVLLVDEQEYRLGGAAAVASMLARLDAPVVLASVVGDDHHAQHVRRLLRQFNLSDDLVVTDRERPTTKKERYIDRAQDRHPQQVLRVDYEVRTPLSAKMQSYLLDRLEASLTACNVVLVSDYDKGVCTPKLLRNVIEWTREHGLRILVDPMRGTDYRKYRGATCLTPNRTKLRLATGLPVDTPPLALAAGGQVLRQLDAEAVVITLDKDGMALAHADGRRQLFPTRPRQVYDITGAGDMAFSVLALCLAGGVDYPHAIALSNVAAGLEVERLGVGTITRDDLLRDLTATPGSSQEKVLALTDLLGELGRWRQEGQRIVFTNGCFDLLHAGHARYLQQARALGHVLVVGLNSDASVRQLKGPDRPINSTAVRAEVLAALACVDYIIVFDEETPLTLIEALCPHVLVKGADYRPDQVVGREFVEAHGGQVLLLPLVPGQSTTRLVSHIVQELSPDGAAEAAS
jgi:D-beta-D-heptose 7-phosphate kinase/D-beta-D-heptose 1-phosphate adenosyltransferase